MATRFPICRTRWAGLLVVIQATLQSCIMTAAIRWWEVGVPQVFSQRTLWTGVKEAFPLSFLHTHFRVPHPSPYLHRKKRTIFILNKKKNALIWLITSQFLPLLLKVTAQDLHRRKCAYSAYTHTHLTSCNSSSAVCNLIHDYMLARMRYTQCTYERHRLCLHSATH